MYFDNKKKRRRSRTIPFGYKLSGNNLLPISSEINSYENVKKLILSGNLSLRLASKKIKKETGRKLSHIGLKIILSKDIPNWNEEAKKSRLLIKKKLIQGKIIEAQKEKSRKLKQCKICRKIKKYKYFRGYSIGYVKDYCNDCYKKLLEKNSQIYLVCGRCKKNKNIIQFTGSDFLKAYKYKFCKICAKEASNKWRFENPKKIKISRIRHYEKKRESFKQKPLEYQRNYQKKLSTIRKKKYKALKKNKKKYSEHLLNKRKLKLFESELTKQDYEKW
ncbi:hypothetical protein CBE37_03135 [bacterium TMED277]|nr:MAG: hypothetical protein CBE37_03135 [bacterium TMED277]|tara:strand:- start:1356 stop:2183 length:828 start_codon:yes stop_codon:yes gene_type:complete